MTLSDQPVGDMGAAHHPLTDQDLACIAETRIGQGLDDGYGASAANLLQTPKPALQRLVRRIDVESHYVDTETLPRHRDLDAGHQDNAMDIRSARGLF